MEDNSKIQQLFDLYSAGTAPSTADFHTGKCFLLLQDPFGLWCNYHAPKEEAVEEDNLYEHMRGKTDRSNRDDWVTAHCPVSEIITGASDRERFYKTLDAMARGVDGIRAASLWDLRNEYGGVWGGVNLLFKVNSGSSIFGDYHYKIVQLKRAGDIKEHYAMQTVLMNDILGQIQGFKADHALFVLKNKEQNLDCSKLIKKAHDNIAMWRAIKDGSFMPDAKKPPKAAMSPWRVYANKFLFENKDLVLIPHLAHQMRDALKTNGIKNYDDIVSAGLPKICDILRDPAINNDALAHQTYYTALAYQKKAPVLRAEGYFPLEAKARNLYFDFEATETFTKDSISFVYLIGIWDKEEDKFVSFVAKSEAEEERIFKEFADYMGNSDAALYHWTEYEVKKMVALCDKYPAIAPDLRKLIAACVDLKIVVEKAFYLPAPSLSLKAAAPAFGFNWRQDDCGAMDSMVYFTNWLKTGDNSLLDKVLMYNEDDCKAMLFVEDYLKQCEVIKP